MPSVGPRVVCSNRGLAGKLGSRASIDWCNGLIAYATQRSVAVVSERTLEVVQTLDDHATSVTAVRFARTTVMRPTVAQAELLLATGDQSGTILLWHVGFVFSFSFSFCFLLSQLCTHSNSEPDRNGSVLSSMHDVRMAVDQMEWHPEQEDILLSYHVAPTTTSGLGVVVLWNTKNAAQLWSRPVHDCSPGLSLQFSPFDPAMFAFATTNGSIFLVHDFDTAALPGPDGQTGGGVGARIEPKFHVTGQTQTLPAQQQQQQASGSSGSGSNDRNKNVLKCFALSPHLWNLCYILMGREIVAYDMSIGRGVGSTHLDKIHDAFHTLVPLADDPDYVVCGHTDTGVSVWKRRRDAFCFDVCAFADIPHIQRFGAKKDSLCSLALAPTDAHRIAVVSPEGTLWLWRFTDTLRPVVDPLERAHTVPSPGLAGALALPRSRARTGVLTAVGQTEAIGNAYCMAVRPFESCNLTSSSGGSSIGNSGSGSNREGNGHESKHVVALGTADGLVQIVDVDRRAVCRTVQLPRGAGAPVQALAWVDAERLVVCSQATTPAARGNAARHEIALHVLDVRSCALRELRAGRAAPHPARCLCVSPRRQYVALSWGPHVELWDLAALALLKTVAFDAPVSSISWLPMKNYVGDRIAPHHHRPPPPPPPPKQQEQQREEQEQKKEQEKEEQKEQLQKEETQHVPQEQKEQKEQKDKQEPKEQQDPKEQQSAKEDDKEEPLAFSEQLLVGLFTEGTSLIGRGSGSGSSPLASSNLRCLVVENTRTVVVAPTELDLGANVLSLASRGPFVAAGDTAGTITCWNAGSAASRAFATHRGAVVRLEFGLAPTAAPGYLLFAQYQSGEAAVWDVTHGRRVAAGTYITGRGLRVLAPGWLDDAPVALTSDHCVRVFDASLSQSTARAASPHGAHVSMPFAALAPLEQLRVLALAHSVGRSAFSPALRSELVAAIGESRVRRLEARASRPADLALAAARYAGYAPTVRFWTLFRAVARRFRCAPGTRRSLLALVQDHENLLQQSVGGSSPVPSSLSSSSSSLSSLPESVPPALRRELASSSSSSSSSSLTYSSSPASPEPVRPESGEGKSSSSSSSSGGKSSEEREPEGEMMEFVSNFTCPGAMRALEGELLAVHTGALHTGNGTGSGTGASAELRQRLGAASIFVGRKEEAVGILLNSSAPGAARIDYVSALKACVVAAAVDRATFAATARMVAGQLIAQGSLQEGAQLLCLVGRAADACKFMISEGRWTDAAWLASVALAGAERAAILARWASFLEDAGLPARALEVALAAGDLHRVLHMLAAARAWELAALVLRALDACGYDVPSAEGEGDAGTAEEGATARRGSKALRPVGVLCDLIHEGYKEYLSGVLHLPDDLA